MTWWLVLTTEGNLVAAFESITTAEFTHGHCLAAGVLRLVEVTEVRPAGEKEDDRG